MTTAEMWRVMCEGGAVREVAVRHTPGSYGGEWRADSGGEAAGGSSARQAVLTLAAGDGWPVTALVAPGETTAAVMHCTPTDGDDDLVKAVRLLVAERDEARADRDYWREQATGMAPSVDGMRALGTRLFPNGTGCVVDPERAVAAVDALRAIVDGRTEAPTDAERAAHSGEWLVRYRGSRAVRWWPLDASGRPTTWPTGNDL